ncbi:hypothetical protein DY000_02062872 [Brassica cretica]|uniref:Uncharacterized protein n=1 Tax=Brassica cretica TaxID=69181 RepID=A0ABQ7AUV8_BRACR|nr:hypothetical protein DY000_02062872 [Brassica cretica]
MVREEISSTNLKPPPPVDYITFVGGLRCSVGSKVAGCCIGGVMIDLLEAYQPWSNPGRPPRVPLPARAKKAGRRKLTRIDQRGLDDPRGRPSAG